jgi:hypothetical protein
MAFEKGYYLKRYGGIGVANDEVHIEYKSKVLESRVVSPSPKPCNLYLDPAVQIASIK